MLNHGLRDPPLVLLHKGTALNFNNCVAIAGTRNPSLYGRIMAEKLARSIAAKGYTIVSGLARGIDEWAHCGALEASKGRTIAVLPWIHPTYPQEHENLLEDILRRGAMVSELFEQPHDKSAPSRFIERNRITSGLSKCVVAVESDAEGGTVQQVRIALSQNRKVFALKPKGSDRAKRGFKTFIDMGATPFEKPKEVLIFLEAEGIKNEQYPVLDAYYQYSL